MKGVFNLNDLNAVNASHRNTKSYIFVPKSPWQCTGLRHGKTENPESEKGREILPR